MEKYEITYLCDENSSIKEAAKILETVGAKVSKETDLGIKKLAYPINKLNSAHYGAILFEIEKSDLAGAEKALKLNKAIIRYLIIKELRTPIPKVVKEKPAGKPEETKTEPAEVKIEAPKVEESQFKREIDSAATKETTLPQAKKTEEKTEEKSESIVKKPAAEKTKSVATEKKAPRKKPAKVEFAKDELDKKLKELTLD